MADDFETRAQEIINGGGPNVIADVKRLARQIKLEKQGFKPDPSGGYVRPSTKQAEDPSPAQAPSFRDKMSEFGEGASEGSAAMLAGAAKNYAFGIPDKVLGAAIPGYRKAADMAVEEQPVSAGIGAGMGIAGSGVAGPEALIGKGAQLVTKGARAAAPALAETAIGRIASAGGEAALSGGASAGASSLARGRSPGEAGRDAVTGAAAGGLIGAPLAAAGEVGRKIVGRRLDKLKQNILNEVAEAGGNRPSPTTRKRLSSADDNILNEVVHGPDADAVRSAYMGGAEKGRVKLGEILDGLGEQKDAAYQAFEQAGRGAVDVNGYLGRVEAMRKAAVMAGDTRKAKAIKAFADDVAATAAESGGLALPQLRQMTTQAQGHASSVLGSLHEHANAKVARQMEQAVTEAMDDTLSLAAAGVPELQEAAQQIRAANQRFNALLSIDDAMKQRAFKEGSKQTGLMAFAKDAKQVGSGGAVIGGVAAGGAGAAAGIAGEALIKHGIPAAARAIDKGLTSAAIRQARGGGAGIPSAARASAVSAPHIQARQAERERDKKRAETLRGRK